MIVRFRGALWLAAAVGTLIPLTGCAPSRDVPGPDATPVTAVPDASAPRAAWLAPGRLLLAYPRPGGDVFLEATWPVSTDSGGAPLHAVAQLDLAAAVPNIEAEPGLRTVRLHGRADWDALLREVFADLAPADPGQATLVAVQGVTFDLDAPFTRMKRVQMADQVRPTLPRPGPPHPLKSPQLS